MHPDVEAVMNELDAHRVQFIVFCRALSSEELDRPVPGSTWLVRDFIAHLATIDGPVGEMFRTIHEGGDPGIRGGDGEKWDVDRWNELQVQPRRSLTVDEILLEAATERTKLRQALAALTAEDLDKTLKFGGDGKRPPANVRVGDYIKGWCKHDPMHAVDMIRAMPEQMNPRLERWFDDPVVRGYQQAMNRPS